MSDAVTVNVVGDVLVIVAPAVAAQEMAGAAFEVGPRRAANGQPFRSVTVELMAKVRGVRAVDVGRCETSEAVWLTGAETRRLLGGLTAARVRQLREDRVLVGDKRGGMHWWFDRESVLAEVARRRS